MFALRWAVWLTTSTGSELDSLLRLAIVLQVPFDDGLLRKAAET